MTFDVRMTPQSEDDLRGIYEYIAFHLRAPMNAARQLDSLETSILSLESLPERYQRYSEAPWSNRNLRIMPVRNYLVFYIPTAVPENGQDETGAVTIVRVMYGGQDVQEQLTRFTVYRNG